MVRLNNAILCLLKFRWCHCRGGILYKKFAISSERYVVNTALLRSHFHLSVTVCSAHVL